MKKAYFENHVLTLSFDEKTHTAYAVWGGFLNSQEFQESTLTCVQLIEEKKVTRWLADNRKMKAIRQADQQWFMENIWPRIHQSPLRKMATLVSEDLFNKMAIEQMVQRAHPLGDLVLCDFEDEAAALAWLAAPLTVAAQEDKIN